MKGDLMFDEDSSRPQFHPGQMVAFPGTKEENGVPVHTSTTLILLGQDIFESNVRSPRVPFYGGFWYVTAQGVAGHLDRHTLGMLGNPVLCLPRHTSEPSTNGTR